MELGYKIELLFPSFKVYSVGMEIERKFIVKTLPDLSSIQPLKYERYFVKLEEGYQERVQRRGDKYEFEIKKLVPTVGNISHHEKTRRQITQEEFDRFKIGKENLGIIRNSYKISEHPDLSIKIYHGRFEGLVRAEIEFQSEEEAKNYVPEEWMGEEITNSPLGMDSRLLQLTLEEFKSLLGRLEK